MCKKTLKQTIQWEYEMASYYSQMLAFGSLEHDARIIPYFFVLVASFLYFDVSSVYNSLYNSVYTMV